MSSVGTLIISGCCILVALALLAAELFLPSHGILSIFSILFALAGVVAAFMTSPALGIVLGTLVLVSAPIAVYWAIRLYPQTGVGKRVMLERPKVQSGSEESEQLAQLAGRQGVAVSTLRPTGLCEFDGRRVACVAESGLIQPGTAVEVTSVAGMKVTVKAV